MPISALELFTGPWQSVATLLEDIQAFYAAHIIPKGLGDQYSVAAEKIVPLRKWGPSFRLIKKNLDPIIRELEISYVPRQMKPGPSIVFPIYNHSGYARNALFHPMWPLIGKEGFPIKYAMLGKEKNEGCPTWFGDTDSVITAIASTRSACVVEGFFDLLACRMLHPGAPVLSSGSKRFGEPHMEWLRMLGIKKVIVAFDNESGSGGKEGPGNLAARLVVRQFNGKHGVQVEAVSLPAKDPAACLTDLRSAYALRTLLTQMFPSIPVHKPAPSARHPVPPASRLYTRRGPRS